jgi:hypothetical protein
MGIRTFDYNPEQAKELLLSAGFHTTPLGNCWIATATECALPWSPTPATAFANPLGRN